MSLPARDAAGNFPAFAHGYPLVYLTRNNNVLCAQCATANTDTEDPTASADVYWEGPPLGCDGCDEPIHSAYGDPAEQT